MKRLALAATAFVTLAGCASATPEEDSSESESGVTQADHRNVDRHIDAAIRAGRFPGAVVYGEDVDHGIVYQRAYGSLAYDASPVTEATIYDLASVTKVMATTVAVMKEVDAGRIDLTRTAKSYLPGLDAAYDRVTVRSLMAHTACFPDGPPSGSIAGRADGEADTVVAWFNRHAGRIAGKGACAAGRATYSDLHIVLAAAVVQKASGKRLDRYLADAVYGPLGMSRTRFNPPAEWRSSIAPTERYSGRDRSGRSGLVHGEVHDETSYYFGGVGGNAGLFSTAGDLGKLAHALVTGDASEALVSRATRDRFFADQGVVDQLGSRRALGWELAPAHCGRLFGPKAVGHTGFTGTSVCLDPERKMFAIVLTNRVHPSRNRGSIGADRVALTSAVVEKIDPCVARPTWTLCGNTPQGDYAGLSGTLYDCKAGKVTRCANECVSAPSGVADYCR